MEEREKNAEKFLGCSRKEKLQLSCLPCCVRKGEKGQKMRFGEKKGGEIAFEPLKKIAQTQKTHFCSKFGPFRTFWGASICISFFFPSSVWFGVSLAQIKEANKKLLCLLPLLIFFFFRFPNFFYAFLILALTLFLLSSD